MEHNDPVFVTQEFDGKEIKNIYHIPISPEIYFKLELIRRYLNLKTINDVIGYFLKKHQSSESQRSNDILINSLEKLSPTTRKKLEEFIDKYGVDALIKLLEDN